MSVCWGLGIEGSTALWRVLWSFVFSEQPTFRQLRCRHIHKFGPRQSQSAQMSSLELIMVESGMLVMLVRCVQEPGHDILENSLKIHTL